MKENSGWICSRGSCPSRSGRHGIVLRHVDFCALQSWRGASSTQMTNLVCCHHFAFQSIPASSFDMDLLKNGSRCDIKRTLEVWIVWPWWRKSYIVLSAAGCAYQPEIVSVKRSSFIVHHSSTPVNFIKIFSHFIGCSMLASSYNYEFRKPLLFTPFTNVNNRWMEDTMILFLCVMGFMIVEMKCKCTIYVTKRALKSD